MAEPISNLSKGFSSTSGSSSGMIGISILLFLILAAYLIYRFYNSNGNRGRREPSNTGTSGMARAAQQVARRPPEFISAQRKVISDIITDFKKREFLAEPVPHAVLEKFAEYFYLNLNRLKMNQAEINKMLIADYPILQNSRIEIEAVINGRLYIFEKKVLTTGRDKIITEPVDQNTMVIPKGQKVLINFSKGKEFISGESQLLSLEWDRMILSYPKKLKIYNERRYARIPVQNVDGEIFAPPVPESDPVRVMDISLEGIRISTSAVLKKKNIYRLGFNHSFRGTNISFQNIECIVSKTFFADKGEREYGMAFLYLDIDTKQKLENYLKILSETSKVKINT